MKHRLAVTLGGMLLALTLATPASAFLGLSLGSDEKKDAAEVSGGAGPDGASGESPKLEKCDKPFGTLAVSEPQDYVGQALMGFGLPSPTGLIRMIIQQSNCFVLVERGRAMRNLMQERELAERGMLRGGSNMGGGQMVTADYVVTPDVVFSQSDAGGVGAALGGLFGVGGAIIAGGLKFKKAQTSMLLADTRTSLQIASATGSAKASDFGLGGILGGGGAVGALGAYENTSEGKVVASSFLDNWNNIVRSIRNNPDMARQAINLKGPSGKPTKAGVGLEEGDVIVGKIGGLKMFTEPSKKSRVIGSLGKGEELIYKGEEKDGYLLVQGNDGEGWVEKVLIKKP